MSPEIEAVTTAALGLALDAASLRQQAIASNIANANTLGYVPQQLNFDTQIETARQSLEAQGQIDASTLSAVRLELSPLVLSNGQVASVHLDQQIAELGENAVRYQALVKGLSQHFALLSQAASDGKK